MTRAVAALALLAAACGSSPLDRSARMGDLEQGHHVRDVPVHGYHVCVQQAAGDEVCGELISVEPDEDHVVVLEGSAPEPTEVPAHAVEHVDLDAYDDHGLVAGATVAVVIGGLSSLSHGWAASISAPIWGATSAVPATIAHQSNVTYERARHRLELLAAYARFPQGRPGHIRSEYRRAPPVVTPVPPPTTTGVEPGGVDTAGGDTEVPPAPEGYGETPGVAPGVDRPDALSAPAPRADVAPH